MIVSLNFVQISQFIELIIIFLIVEIVLGKFEYYELEEYFNLKKG